MDVGGLVHTFFDNAGPGGVFVLFVIGAACTTYYLLTRWILAGGKSEESTTPDEQSVSTDA